MLELTQQTCTEFNAKLEKLIASGQDAQIIDILGPCPANQTTLKLGKGE